MRLKEILETTIPGLGYELVDIEITPAKLVRVFIDKDNNGVTVEDCELVSNHINRLFFVEEIDYNRLEVSSPGLERPLKKLSDYVKFQGKMAKIKTHELINEKKIFQGIITQIVDDLIELTLDSGEKQEIKFGEINKARLVFENTKNTKVKNKNNRSKKG